MLGIQLTTLSQPELRRLLEVSRARGQDALVRQLEAELAARPGRISGLTQPAALSTSAFAAPPPPEPRRSRAPALLVAGLATCVGATVAWGFTTRSFQPAPQVQPAAFVSTAPEPRVSVALSAPLPEEAPLQLPEEPAAPAVEHHEVAVADQAPGRNPCYDLATARERLVCGYPSLAIQERRLKAVLDHARAAGVDVKALETTQASWNSGTANISDRQVLAERYVQRIAEIQAQTE